MNDRIKQVRASAELTQTEFADKLGLTKNYISLVENGNREPSERTLNDICRIFGVDPVWLRTGTGEPFKPMDRNEQIAVILGKAIAGNDSARDRIIRSIAQLPDELFPYAEKILEEIAENLQKEKSG